MPIDLPPPLIVTTMSEPATETVSYEVYGPVDTEQADQGNGAEAEESSLDCPQVSENVIVVCARVDNEKYRLRELPPAPHSKTFNEEVVDALSVTRGNTTVGLIAPGQVGIKIKF